MDAEALYPSLHLENILQGVWDLILSTTGKLENIDFKETAKYAAIIYNRENSLKT